MIGVLLRYDVVFTVTLQNIIPFMLFKWNSSEVKDLFPVKEGFKDDKNTNFSL